MLKTFQFCCLVRKNNRFCKIKRGIQFLCRDWDGPIFSFSLRNELLFFYSKPSYFYVSFIAPLRWLSALAAHQNHLWNFWKMPTSRCPSYSHSILIYLGWGGAQALVFFKSSPDDSSVCLGLGNFVLPMFWLRCIFLLYHKEHTVIFLTLTILRIYCFPFTSCLFPSGFPLWPFWLVAKHLKTAFPQRLPNVTYTHKYMQCRYPILFYFGSENDYPNKEKMSTTSGPLDNKHRWDHSIGMLANLEEERNHSFIIKHLFFLIPVLEIISIDSKKVLKLKQGSGLIHWLLGGEIILLKKLFSFIQII